MAQVKFYQGLQSAAASNPEGSIGFLNKAGEAAGYIYLGNNMVATKYLRDLDLTGFDSRGGLLEIGTNDSNPFLTTRSLITSTSSTYSWGSNDNVPTAKVIADFVSKKHAAADLYHATGSWGTDSDPWYEYTAKCYQGSTEITPSGSGYKELKFELPISEATGSSYSSDSTHLTTPAQVAAYIGQLAGAMEYKGGLTTAMYTTHPAYEPGDVFIAQNENASLGIEEGDMVIVNTAMAANAEFVTKGDNKNCDVFERNLDGAVAAANPLNPGRLIVGNGSKTIKTLDTTAGGLVYSSAANTVANLPIGTSGQHLIVSSSKPAWGDSIYYKVALKPNTSSGGVTTYNDDTLVITQNKNGQDRTSEAVELQINHVAEATHAASADSADSATNAAYVGMSEASENSAVPILVRGAQNSNTTNYGVKYDSQVTVNPSTNTLAATEVALTQSSTTINVFDTLTWHTLGS
jgi:hypothetical protein